jgi:hypothetical protein
MKLSICMVIINLSLFRVDVRTHIRQAHGLVDNYVSQVIDMEVSNQSCGHML